MSSRRTRRERSRAALKGSPAADAVIEDRRRDTSALLKLYVQEDGSEDVERAVAGSDRIATSAAAYPEARAAFARLERQGEISPEQHGAITDLDSDWPLFGAADLTRTFARFRGRTAARFGLRGYVSRAYYYYFVGSIPDSQEPVILRKMALDITIFGSKSDKNQGADGLLSSRNHSTRDFPIGYLVFTEVVL